jgi:pSer/pThr/pTyr-binding forkhead associated (FHA) protein
MKVRLIALSSVEHDRKLALNGHSVVLGRCPEADVRIDDRWVSRRHCELVESDGMLVVRDLGSTHGTFVNGRQVTEARLRPEDKLTVGLTSFVASYRAATRLARVH